MHSSFKRGTLMLSSRNILIVDDHQMLRDGIKTRLSLESDLQVCGEASSEDEALAQVKETNPDLVIVDLSLKTGHGISLMKQIKARDPKVKMLVVSGYDESLYAVRSLRAGAMGYVNKRDANEKIVEGIRAVLEGELFVSPAITNRLVGRALGTSEPTGSPIDTLSDRELEIFGLIGQGLTTGAIARQLHLSTHTIDSHREKIKQKLGSRNAGELTREAVIWVLENG